MIERKFAIALVISLALHVLSMSVISIVTPNDAMKLKTYTRVNFLGPILRKTAFDIMLENANPLNMPAYRHNILIAQSQSGSLKISDSKRTPSEPEFPESLENNMDMFILAFLAGSKTVPEFRTDFGAAPVDLDGERYGPGRGADTRKVIYKPDPPSITPGLYGDKEQFDIKLRVMVAGNGKVQKVEPITTSGYPQVDLSASEFIRGWIFEPRDNMPGSDEWLEIGIVLKAGNN